MKLKFITLSVFFIFLITTSFEPDVPVDTKASNYNIVLEDLKNQTVEAYNSIATYKAEEIFTVLSYNVKRFENFYENLQNLDNIFDALSLIISELEELRDGYALIANYRTDIENNLDNKLEVVSNTILECDNTILEIEAEIEQLNLDIAELDSLIENETNSNQQALYESDRNAKLSVLNSTTSIKNTFVEADTIFTQLFEDLTIFADQLRLLMNVMTNNVTVYDAVIDALKSNLVYSTLTNELLALQNLTGLTDDIIDSWQDLDDIVNQINNLTPNGGGGK